MAITKDLEIKISNDQASFTEKFYVYQYDRGIELNIKVSLSKMQIGGRNTSLLSELENATCGVIILKPNGSVIGRNNLEITNDVIKFVIDKELTDDFDEVGTYSLQFHLYDGEDNRITIPPVTFEVKSLIGIVPNTR